MSTSTRTERCFSLTAGGPAVLFLAALLLMSTGCDTDAPSLVDAPDPAASGEAAFPISNRAFVGRDSFGVSFKADVSGVAEAASDGRCPELTVRLSGTGRATHMGRINVRQSHCLDPDDPSVITDGRFTYEGRGGTRVSGTYKESVALKDGGAGVETWVEISGGDLRFTRRDIEGRALLSGTLHGPDAFSYRLDGWLLHHVRSNGG